MTYDTNNIFAKIIRGEIPATAILDTEYVLAFADINPQKKVHLLVLPKQSYTDISDFGKNASAAEKVAIFDAIAQIAADQGLEEDGYRVITNQGDFGGQEIPHLHFHILGGEAVGRMVDPKTLPID